MYRELFVVAEAKLNHKDQEVRSKCMRVLVDGLDHVIEKEEERLKTLKRLQISCLMRCDHTLDEEVFYILLYPEFQSRHIFAHSVKDVLAAILCRRLGQGIVETGMVVYTVDYSGGARCTIATSVDLLGGMAGRAKKYILRERGWRRVKR